MTAYPIIHCDTASLTHASVKRRLHDDYTIVVTLCLESVQVAVFSALCEYNDGRDDCFDKFAWFISPGDDTEYNNVIKLDQDQIDPQMKGAQGKVYGTEEENTDRIKKSTEDGICIIRKIKAAATIHLRQTP